MLLLVHSPAFSPEIHKHFSLRGRLFNIALAEQPGDNNRPLSHKSGVRDLSEVRGNASAGLQGERIGLFP